MRASGGLLAAVVFAVAGWTAPAQAEWRVSGSYDAASGLNSIVLIKQLDEGSSLFGQCPFGEPELSISMTAAGRVSAPPLPVEIGIASDGGAPDVSPGTREGVQDFVVSRWNDPEDARRALSAIVQATRDVFLTIRDPVLGATRSWTVSAQGSSIALEFLDRCRQVREATAGAGQPAPTMQNPPVELPPLPGSTFDDAPPGGVASVHVSGSDFSFEASSTPRLFVRSDDVTLTLACTAHSEGTVTVESTDLVEFPILVPGGVAFMLIGFGEDPMPVPVGPGAHSGGVARAVAIDPYHFTLIAEMLASAPATGNLVIIVGETADRRKVAISDAIGALEAGRAFKRACFG